MSFLTGVKALLPPASGLARAASRGILLLQKASPDILTGVGVVGVVATAVLAGKATLKLEDLVDEAKEELDTVRELSDIGESTGEKYAYSKNVSRVYSKTAFDLAKLYGPTVVVGVASIGCLLGSHHILKQRNAALMTAYKVLDSAHKNYRKRVREEHGEEADRKYAGGVHTSTELVEDPETGKNHRTTKVWVNPEGISEYARWFDETSPQYSRVPGYNLSFITGIQKYANHKLSRQGHVFLNEIYDDLGFPRSAAGAVVGWIYEDKDGGDGYIDFGIYDLEDEHARDFVNGYEKAILLDFNVDGVIYDKI